MVIVPLPFTYHGNNFHRSLARMKPVIYMQDSSAVKLSRLLSTTVLAPSYVLSKLEVAGLCPRYSGDNSVFEVGDIY